MVARPPLTPGRRSPVITPMRVIAVLAVLLLVVLGTAPLFARDPLAGAYLLLVLATIDQLRRVRAEPGSLLGRRPVRRGLVLLTAALCGALLATPSPSSAGGSGPLLVLFLLLVVLNIGLGRATQRVATAADRAVDERQEALRNRAHRVAYAILAGLGGVLAVCDVASTQSRSWLVGSLGGGGLVAIGELLFVLPAMVIAFLEPSRIPAETIATPSTRDRVTAWLVGVTLALPLVLSAGFIVLPVQLSATTGAPSSNGDASSAATCREFSASRAVGVLVSASVPLHADVCWDGRRAVGAWGLNATDCLFVDSVLAGGSTASCRRVTDAAGTLSFTYTVELSPVMLPFLHREVTMHLVVDRNGAVEEFP